MAWIESHQTLAQHPKLKRLAALLKVSKPTAVGHLHYLWWWAAEYAQDGDCSGFTPSELADAAQWRGCPDRLTAALLESGFLEAGKKIHDWEIYFGRLLANRQGNAARQKQFRERQRNRYVTVTPEIVTVTSQTTVTDVTGLPNPTVPNPTQPNTLPPPPVELPASFPQTELAARRSVGPIGCPEQFAADVWNKAASRGGKDSRGQVIESFPHYLATEWKYERERMEKNRTTGQPVNGKKPLSVFDRRSIIEAKMTQAKEIKRVYCSDVAMGESWNNKAKRAEYYGIMEQIRKINNEIAKMA